MTDAAELAPEAGRAGGVVGSGTPAGQCLRIIRWARDLFAFDLPVVVVRLADAAGSRRDSVDGLAQDSCSCSEEEESDLHLGGLVATVGCLLKSCVRYRASLWCQGRESRN